MPLPKVATGGGRGGLGQIIHKFEWNSVLFALGFNCKVPINSNVSYGDSTSENLSAIVPAEMLENRGVHDIPVWAKT